MTTNARTDSDTGLRFYTWQGVEYPSVTTVRKMLGMPHNLHQWVLSRVVDRAVDDAEKVIEMRDRPAKPRERVRDKNARAEARKWVRHASVEARDVAAARGSAIHEAVALGIEPKDIPDPEVAYRVALFQQFLIETGAKVLTSERQVFNLSMGYAGALDSLIEMPAHLCYQWPEGADKTGTEIVLADTKSGAGLYVDNVLQLIAYGNGEFIGEHDRVDADATALLHRATKMALLHLTDNGWEMVFIQPSPEMYRAFLGSIDTAVYLHNHPDLNALVSATIRGK